MKTFNYKQAKKRIANFVMGSNPLKDFSVDNDGRIVIFTDLFFWKDGSIHDEEESHEDDPELYEEFSFTDTSTEPKTLVVAAEELKSP